MSFVIQYSGEFSNFIAVFCFFIVIIFDQMKNRIRLLITHNFLHKIKD